MSHATSSSRSKSAVYDICAGQDTKCPYLLVVVRALVQHALLPADGAAPPVGRCDGLGSSDIDPRGGQRRGRSQGRNSGDVSPMAFEVAVSSSSGCA